MTGHKYDNYILGKSPVATYKRKEKNKPIFKRVFEIDELDGFYVDNELDRTIHITFEEEDVILIDIYNSDQAAINPDIGEAIGIIELNLRTGKAKFFTEGR